MDPPGDGSTGKPPGWRAEWREPKKRAKGPLAVQESQRRAARASRRAASHARARVVALQPVPPAEELKQRGVAVLLEVMEGADEESRDRINAAAKVVELATRGKVGGTDLERLSDEELEAKGRELAKRFLGQKTGTGTEGSEGDG